MKRFFCFFIIFIMIFLSSCTDKKSDAPQSSLDRDAFLGKWLYEVYKNDEKYFGLIYEFEKTDGSYHGVIKKFDDDEDSGKEFDDFIVTKNKLIFLRGYEVIAEKEYYLTNDKLVIGDDVYIKQKKESE